MMRFDAMRVGEVVILVAAVGVAGSASVAQPAEPIAIGPYVQNVTPDGATLCWSTLEGRTKITKPDGTERVVRRYRQHEILLTYLRAGATYSYDVLGDGRPEGKGSFTTFPKEASPFRFVVFGDTRSRYAVHQKLVDRIIDKKPLLVVNTGDLVGDGRDIEHWEKFFEISRRLMRTVPYYPVLGNHERDSRLYYDFFNLPGNERYYSFVVGDAFFLVLDTEGEDYEMPGFVKEENRDEFWNNYNLPYFERQKTWAGHRLALHRDAGFLFVFFHQPLFSVKASRVEDAKLRRAFWGDLFERHGVQVVFSGHDHHYHHALNNGTHYITTGGGGAPLYDGDALQPQTVKFAKIEHFLTVDVGLKEAKLTAVDIDGKTVEQITVPRRE